MELEEDYSYKQDAPGNLKSILLAGGVITLVLSAIFVLGRVDDSDVPVDLTKNAPSAEELIKNPATEPGIEWPVSR